jgi:hypothetical protein
LYLHVFTSNFRAPHDDKVDDDDIDDNHDDDDKDNGDDNDDNKDNDYYDTFISSPAILELLMIDNCASA